MHKPIYDELIEMGLINFDEAVVDAREDLSLHQKAIDELLSIARSESGPWSREDLQERIVAATHVPWQNVWQAVNDLLVDGYLREYHGDHAGDLMSGVYEQT
ncbi:hypothetical protein ABZ896_17085 [Streptomyces sp. NPDC047072]|uniref:hypothetical protein n=1 Tax=Streptomyces sp. NPDC047072 TaxID=3154809 RepID=UPI0033E00238